MKPDRTRLTLAAMLYYSRLVVPLALFLGWLGWLGYLAATKTNPIVVSHSQVMASTNFVLAQVTRDPDTGQPDKQVKVVQDLRPLSQPIPAGTTITVQNIKDARIAGGADGFKDPGPYLLPLTAAGDGTFRLTPPPPAPGAEGSSRLRPWAYVWSAPGVQQQFEALVGKPPGG
jgi:hypothetical protein